MEKKSSTDTFGTFLENVQQQNKMVGEQARRNVPQELLRGLLDSGPKPVVKLMPESGLPFTEFARIIKEMEEADFIQIQGSSGEETVELTPIGEKVARFADE